MRTLSRRATWVIIALGLLGLFGNIVMRPSPPPDRVIRCGDIQPPGGGLHAPLTQ